MVIPAWADAQFRIAGSAVAPMEFVLQDAAAQEYDVSVRTNEMVTGWYWEVLVGRLGGGMHYATQTTQAPAGNVAPAAMSLDWRGDFFLSYHVLGAGSVLDPFLEFGWGNAGSALISNGEDLCYPSWEDEVARGTATALSFYRYAAGGVAIDLDGVLLGLRVSYLPAANTPLADASLEAYELPEFEVSVFGGAAFGGHRHPRRRVWPRWR